jgi:hypothetical protein
VIWSIIDILSIAMVIAVQATYHHKKYWSPVYYHYPLDAPWIRVLAAITTGLLWLKAVSFLKMVKMHLATFVFALVEVRKSIAAFHVPSNHKISYSRSFSFHRRPIDPPRYLLVSLYSRHYHGCFCTNLSYAFIRRKRMLCQR